eukprot:505951-Rhodomonas_salina.3
MGEEYGKRGATRRKVEKGGEHEDRKVLSMIGLKANGKKRGARQMRWMPPVSGSAGSTTGKSQLTMLVGHLSRNDSGSFAAKKSKVCSPLGEGAGAGRLRTGHSERSAFKN